MTQAPERERAPRLGLPEVRRDEGAWLPALLLALRTTAYGLIAVELVVLVLWMGAAHAGASAAETLRLGLTFWTAAHHGSVHIGPDATIGLVPFTLTLFPAWLLHRGTRTLLLADERIEPHAVVPALAACYGLVVAALAVVARGPVVKPEPAEAFVGAAVVAGLASYAAVLRVRGLPDRVPADLARAAYAALRSAGLLVLAGLVAAVLLVVVRHHDVAATQHALNPGTTGTVGLVLVQLLAVPVVAIWGSSVLAGPGFGLGAHTSVSITGAHLGQVPALPMLAALPGHGAFAPVLWLALVVPIGIGALTARWALDEDVHWRDQLRPVGLSAAASGLLWAVIAWLGDGSAGPGRLAVAGPSPWQLGLVVGAETGLGLLLVVAVRAARGSR